MRTEHKGGFSWPQATHHVEALARWTFPWTVSGLKIWAKMDTETSSMSGQGLCDALPCDIHNNYKTQMCFATHLRAMCTVFTRQRSALRHLHAICTVFTTRRCALCAPPRDLHSITNAYEHWTWALFISEVRFSRTSARSAQYYKCL